MGVVGRGVETGSLPMAAVEQIVADGVAALPLDSRRVLVIVPDGTRTMPMPEIFAVLDRELGRRTAALDVLVALGTHAPMSDAQLSRLLGQPVHQGRAGAHHVFNHDWRTPETFVDLGTIPASEIAALTGGQLAQDVPVALNRLLLAYDHILICGPVFPHEVAGFSGGTKYLFPGVAAAPIIHFTHWLGALMTSYAIIGTADTPVRRVINRAASMLPTPISLVALVVSHHDVLGAFCGDVQDAWRRAADLSSRRHIVWLDRPVARVLSVMPPMYDDLWTAAKGMYKAEPAVADDGEVVILAPHVREVSLMHGPLIEAIGYHCRDYFLAQWERFKDYPGGILAHSTHVKGLGTFDAATGVERPRIRVTLATGISSERTRHVNLGYQDPSGIDPETWRAEAGTLVIPRAGELLYRVGRPPAPAEASA